MGLCIIPCHVLQVCFNKEDNILETKFTLNVRVMCSFSSFIVNDQDAGSGDDRRERLYCMESYLRSVVFSHALTKQATRSVKCTFAAYAMPALLPCVIPAHVELEGYGDIHCLLWRAE